MVTYNSRFMKFNVVNNQLSTYIESDTLIDLYHLGLKVSYSIKTVHIKLTNKAITHCNDPASILGQGV